MLELNLLSDIDPVNCAAGMFVSPAAEPLKLMRAPLPNPPWPPGDERGMANQIGSATWNRCAWHMTQPGAQSYELSQVRSATMPLPAP